MRILTVLSLMLLSLPGLSAPKADLWPHFSPRTPPVKLAIDHGGWDALLQRYVDTTGQPHLVAYSRVSESDRQQLADYLQALQAETPQRLTRAEQMAYWINLYNAQTVALILDHYPVKSITKIKSGFFSFGPWDRKLLSVDGEQLSLNDIEHRILRPIFDDPRIHYAVNCASLGCPDLAGRAYTSGRLEEMLDAAARRFVNHPRGVRIDDGELIVSSIYEWFRSDFGGSNATVIAHLRKYADRELKEELARHEDIDDHEYDWALNDAP